MASNEASPYYKISYDITLGRPNYRMRSIWPSPFYQSFHVGLYYQPKELLPQVQLSFAHGDDCLGRTAALNSFSWSLKLDAGKGQEIASKNGKPQTS